MLNIKEGLYTLKIENLICQTGSYKNNQRSGTWQIYYSKDELEFEYNYDTKELTY
jgi:antitoxin component YwqK of YwqJK toxin-antitoxin module